MLTRIFIQNLATVEEQVIEFGAGFTVMTGETGAGKSIIVKAINLVMGMKCPKDLIRTGKSYLAVEAVFDISRDHPARELLSELDIEWEGAVSIRRKVHATGKNSVFINDHTATLSTLSRLGTRILDLHGQHSQQSLLKTATHIDYFDEFAGLRERVSEFRELYELFQSKQALRRELERNTAERGRKIDFNRFQIDEINGAGFTHDEESQLLDDLNRLNHGDRLISSLSPIAEWNSSETSPLTEISATLRSLEDIQEVDAGHLGPIVKEIQTGLITLEEAVIEVNQYLGKIEINPQRLEEINERLSLLDKLKRKYGMTLDDINSYKEKLERELEVLESAESDREGLEKEIEKLFSNLSEKAENLSTRRRKSVDEFERLVLADLHELGMEQSLFKVDLNLLPLNEGSQQSFSTKGQDRLEFKIATNPGTPLKPLTKIASGGELSRIMLAIKTTLKENLSQETMVFDEIDSGISGRVAEMVGYKLAKLGRSRQVISITHSPQIASKADTHFRVQKTVNQESSETTLLPLEGDERVEEIARFLGGNKLSTKTLSAAREMLNQGVGN